MIIQFNVIIEDVLESLDLNHDIRLHFDVVQLIQTWSKLCIQNNEKK